MWILPTNLLTSLYAQDTTALDLDLKEQGLILASLFMWRSKPSPATTWSRRLKREPWVRELSGQILNPSHTNDLEDALIYCLEDFRASRSVKQVREGAMKTPDTYSPSSSKELGNASPTWLSSKTSRELSAPSSKGTTGTTPPERPFCSMSLESWKEWVTEQRQSRRVRQKSVLLTSGTDGSLSGCWPTAKARDWKDTLGCSLDALNPDGSHRCRRDHLVGAVAAELSGHPLQGKNSSDGSLLKSWGTPRTSMARDLHTDTGNSKLGEQIQTGLPITKKLNPRWVETLMGLPVGWVMPSCKDPVTIEPMNSDCLEMESCQHPAPQPSSEDCQSWPTPAVFDTTGGPYHTEIRNGAFRSKHDNKIDSPWYGAKLKDAVRLVEE